MKLGISTGIFYQQDLLENLPAIARAGFRSVELCTGALKDGKVLHYDWRDGAYTDRLRRTLQELGLTVSTMHAPYSPSLDPSHPEEARRNETLDELCGVARVLKSLGGQALVLHVGVNEFNLGDHEEKRRRLENVRKFLPPLLEVTRPLGLRLALENLLPHILGGELEVLTDLLKPFPPEQAGLCYDTSHAHLWGGEAVYAMLERALPRLVATHLSDSGGKFDDHFVPGEGNIDWRRIRDLLSRGRYDGTVTLEVFRDPKGSALADVLAASRRRAEELLAF
jgi:sugar phosphate isomerase/epimerase